MTIKELKAYIKQFPNDAEVVVSGWFHDGPRYYTPNIPSHPIKLNVGKTPVSVIGCFDDCMAHRVIQIRSKEVRS